MHFVSASHNQTYQYHDKPLQPNLRVFPRPSNNAVYRLAFFDEWHRVLPSFHLWVHQRINRQSRNHQNQYPTNPQLILRANVHTFRLVQFQIMLMDYLRVQLCYVAPNATINALNRRLLEPLQDKAYIRQKSSQYLTLIHVALASNFRAT